MWPKFVDDVIVGVFVFNSVGKNEYEVVVVYLLMKDLSVTTQCVEYLCCSVTWSYGYMFNASLL